MQNQKNEKALKSSVQIGGCATLVGMLLLCLPGCTTDKGRVLERSSSWTEDVAQHGVKAVLQVISRNGQVGSGFVIHRSGLALTNAHVVKQSSGGVVYYIRADGFRGQAPFEVLAVGPSRDLALLKIPAGVTQGALQLSRDERLELGQRVAAIGSPQGMFPVFTSGVFGGRLVPGSLAGALIPVQLIHSAPTLRGSSGCPLMDENGRVVGVSSAKPNQELVQGREPKDEIGKRFNEDLKRGHVQTEMYGLAIPSTDVLRYMPTWVSPEWVTGLETGFEVAPLGEGATIRQVTAGSAAERAGLQVGDRVIRLGDEAIGSSVDLAVMLLKKGQTELRVLRGDSELQVSFQRTPVVRPDWEALKPGLTWAEFIGRFEVMPDFFGAQPHEVGFIDDIALPTDVGHHGPFALEIKGWIKVPKAGEWVFELASDDGSQLFIRDRMVVDGDGLHATRSVRGTIELEAGVYPIRVRFFDGGGEKSLWAKWGLEGEELKTISGDTLRH